MKAETTLRVLMMSAMLLISLDGKAECGAAARGVQASAPESIAGPKSNCLRITRESPPHTSPATHSVESIGSNNTSRWQMTRELGAVAVTNDRLKYDEYETPVVRSINEVRWADSHDWIHNPPGWVREVADNARGYKKRGMPIIHLWDSQSRQATIAIGVNPHGHPGLYFSQKLPF